MNCSVANMRDASTLKPGPPSTPKAVLASLEARLAMRHASPRTIEAYGRWVRRFITFSGRKDPRLLGKSEVTQFLSSLATQDRVSASTQNQALAALLFLYKEVFGTPLEYLDELVHAKRSTRLPVVLSRSEVAALLQRLTPPSLLMAELLYGAGLRLMECVTLRIKDVDFERHQLTVRRGKGGKDRVALLPTSLAGSLREHLRLRAIEHKRQLAKGEGRVDLPFALGRKYPRAPLELSWQWLFPATRSYVDPTTTNERAVLARLRSRAARANSAIPANK